MNLLERNDCLFMSLALKEAMKADERGEVPVGAVIVVENQIIAKAHNQVEMLKDATAHAEILAITQASSSLKDWRLTKAILYVTKEPCSMCAGAMVNARVSKIVYGVGDSRSGAAGSAIDITGFEGNLHKVEVVSGVLEDPCRDILQKFFQDKRKEKI